MKNFFKKKRDEKGGSQESRDLSIDLDIGEVLVTTSLGRDSEWILDYGCSFHMCPNLKAFRNHSMVKYNALLRNNLPCQFIDIGSVCLQLYNGIVKTLTSVRHVLGSKENLVFF